MDSPASSPSERPIVVVEVGSPPREFAIYESLLVEHSGFFRGALSGYFLESKTRRIPLHDDDPSLFEYLVEWLFLGDLHPYLRGDESDTCELSDLPPIVDTLFNLWILGDKLQMPSLQNATTRALIDLVTNPNCPKTSCNLTQLPGNSTLSRVYDNTLPKSPLRRLAIDVALLTGAGHGLLADDSAAEELEPEILLDLARRAVAFWHHETASIRFAKRTYLRSAEGCYDVASLCPPGPSPTTATTTMPPGRFVLPDAPPFLKRPVFPDIEACDHQRALGGLLPMQDLRLLTEGGGENGSDGVYLSAECAQSLDGGGGGEAVRWQESQINLDELLDNDDGSFRWLKEPRADGKGNFSLTARGLRLVEKEGGIELSAELCTREQWWRPTFIPLSDKIINRWGRLEYQYDTRRCACETWDVLLY